MPSNLYPTVLKCNPGRCWPFSTRIPEASPRLSDWPLSDEKPPPVANSAQGCQLESTWPISTRIRVSRLFNLIKLTGSRDQPSPNFVVQFLKYTCAVPSPRSSAWLLSDLMRSLHLLPTQPKVASGKVPEHKVVPISVQYPEPWIPGKTTYLQFNHPST